MTFFILLLQIVNDMLQTQLYMVGPSYQSQIPSIRQCVLVHIRAVCVCVCFGYVRVQLTDGTVCNELLCDNYGACWGKLEKKKCWWVWESVCLCVNEARSDERVFLCNACTGVLCRCAGASRCCQLRGERGSGRRTFTATYHCYYYICYYWFMNRERKQKEDYYIRDKGAEINIILKFLSFREVI